MNELANLLDDNFGYTSEVRAKELAERILNAGYAKVVRCSDCIHKPHYDGRKALADDPQDFTCPYLSGDPWESDVPDDDFFCAYGERKQEEGQP